VFRRRADWLASSAGEHITIEGFEDCRALFGLTAD
jgi:hypothetical protein